MNHHVVAYMVLTIVAMFTTMKEQASIRVYRPVSNQELVIAQPPPTISNTMLPNQKQTLVIEKEQPQPEEQPPKNNRMPISLQERLCPGGVPNTDEALQMKIFELARDLILKDDNNSTYQYETKRFRPNLNIRSSYFNGTFDGASYFLDPNNANVNMAYMRIWKAANNQIRFWEAHNYLNTTSKGTELPFKELPDLLHEMQDKNRSVKDLCIVTVIRDPISHFLSGYNEAVTQLHYKRMNKRSAPHRTMKSLSPADKFRQSVLDLLNMHPDFRRRAYWHLYSMSRILVALHDNNLSLSGYLPSLKDINQRYPQFVRQTCPNIPTRYLDHGPMPMLGQHESSSDPLGYYEGAKQVWKEQGAVAKALCLLRAVDYACWEDLPDGVPTLCQQVYDEYLVGDDDDATTIRAEPTTPV